MDGGWIEAAKLAEFGAARKLVRDINGESILLYRLGDEFVAVKNACTHLGERLDGGRIIAGQIHCPFHGACFDLRTGKALSGPAVAPLIRFDVKAEDGALFVRPMTAPAA